MMAVPFVLVHLFNAKRISYLFSFKRVQTFEDLASRALETFEKAQSQWTVHFHFADELCEGRVSPSEWDAGAYFDDCFSIGNELVLYAHFEPKELSGNDILDKGTTTTLHKEKAITNHAKRFRETDLRCEDGPSELPRTTHSLLSPGIIGDLRPSDALGEHEDLENLLSARHTPGPGGPSFEALHGRPMHPYVPALPIEKNFPFRDVNSEAESSISSHVRVPNTLPPLVSKEPQLGQRLLQMFARPSRPLTPSNDQTQKAMLGGTQRSSYADHVILPPSAPTIARNPSTEFEIVHDEITEGIKGAVVGVPVVARCLDPNRRPAVKVTVWDTKKHTHRLVYFTSGRLALSHIGGTARGGVCIITSQHVEFLPQYANLTDEARRQAIMSDALAAKQRRHKKNNGKGEGSQGRKRIFELSDGEDDPASHY